MDINLTVDELKIVVVALQNEKRNLIALNNQLCNGELVEFDENDPLDKYTQEVCALFRKLGKIYNAEGR